jgi:hypothetical protein
MFLVVIVTIIVYPFLPLVWSALSFFGFFGFFLVFAAYLVHTWFPPRYKQFKDTPVFSLPFGLETPAKIRISRAPAREKQTEVYSVLNAILRDWLEKQLMSFKQTANFYGMISKSSENLNPFGTEESAEESLLDHSVEVFCIKTIRAINSIRNQNLYDSWCVRILEILKNHFIRYKKLREEFAKYRSTPNLFSGSNRHLDDFNDFAYESEDESMRWSSELDSVHEQIVLRMIVGNELHPSAGKGVKIEMDHVRDKLMQFLDLVHIDELPVFQNKIFQILIREWTISKLIWPSISKICGPNHINNIIIENANRRLAVLRVVKAFKADLDSDFKEFPPIFLINNTTKSKYSLEERIRFAENIQRYCRNANSQIDLCAVRNEVIVEIRRKTAEIGNLFFEIEEMQDKGAEYEDAKRFLRNLKIVLRKIEKREKFLFHRKRDIQNLMNTKAPNTKESPSQPSADLKLDITLAQLLDRYFRSAESADMHSMALYYFVDFLEKRKDQGQGINLLRFWSEAEKYRYMNLIQEIGLEAGLWDCI